ncbi:MAG: CinA family protein [Panacagrimonas sp.]
MTSSDAHALARQLCQTLLHRRQTMAVAESCTGGLVAKICTDLAGSSAWFGYGVVSYSNQAKQRFLGVDRRTLEQDGAVSRACAEQMVTGLLEKGTADWGVALTGIAGPGGGGADKPVGSVWMAWKQADTDAQSQLFCFDGDRAQVREQSAVAALQGLLQRMG